VALQNLLLVRTTDEALTEAVARTVAALTVVAVPAVAVAVPIAAVAVDFTAAADFSAVRAMVADGHLHHGKGVPVLIEVSEG
jgi:hypothetical protein